jgi:hypothetical protein
MPTAGAAISARPPREGALPDPRHRLSVVLVHALNGVEAAAYRTSGFRVADVATAFSTNDFAHREQLPGVGSVPRNVHRICSWTYMCARNDIHANTAGYRQIALTFAKLLQR